ncbi:MAG: heparan-alpha-glucosaminide N-acetyltransferase [Hyphomicrobiales bacterium]|jgi:uncharacterized membrane protein|nr:heparan-alpha-glucosaminide N-acetyltransferase [Hyphomicrobiales bacterium]
MNNLSPARAGSSPFGLADPARPVPAQSPRIGLVDLARGLALAAMVVFHGAWDLSFLGFVQTDISADPGWRLFSHLIAGSFLLLAGLSLGLAHGRLLRPDPFRDRVVIIAGAALLVTLGTWAALSDRVVLFGILHCIALGSLLCRPLLRGPWWVPALLAVPVGLLPLASDHPALSTLQSAIAASPLHGLWRYSGLSLLPPVTVDFVPIFPWFAITLVGLSLGLRLARGAGAGRLAAVTVPSPLAPLAWAGRRSLPIYLIHQPVLIGCLMLVSYAMPGLTVGLASRAEATFRRDCVQECRSSHAQDVCNRSCNCVIEMLRQDPARFTSIVIEGRNDKGSTDGINAAVTMCFRPPASGG